MNANALGRLRELVRRYPALASSAEETARAVELIADCHRAGRKILICGNGGSAADAEHMIGELVKGFHLPRRMRTEDVDMLRKAGLADWPSFVRSLQPGLRAISLVGHPALATALINDGDPQMLFAQQVYVLGQAGDVLLASSTSGESRNILNALKIAKTFGLVTIGLCGGARCGMDAVCDCAIHVPETETFKVQELHLPVYHAICLAVEEELFGAGSGSSQSGEVY